MRTFLILAANFPDNGNTLPGEDHIVPDIYPQITAVSPALPFADDTTAVDALLQALPGAVFHLHEDAEFTHVLSQTILPPPGLLVSPEFADFLRQYNLPPECSFHETTVEHQGTHYLAWWLHISGFHTGMIDFETTRFARFRSEYSTHRAGNWGRSIYQPREIPVHSEQELLGHMQELLAKHTTAEDEDIPEPEIEEEIEDDIPWEELSEEEQQAREEELAELALSTADTLEEDEIEQEMYLDAIGHEIYMTEQADYDLLIFPFPHPALFVSEQMAEGFQDFDFTGYTLLPFTYEVYP